MNNKLFAYNTGLKSRFQEVIFEDFDETELSQSLGAKADGLVDSNLDPPPPPHPSKYKPIH
jgi:hypothetical protein